MDAKIPPEIDPEISEAELEKLDDDLLEIDILYKTRCMQVPFGSNVTVREIADKKE